MTINILIHNTLAARATLESNLDEISSSGTRIVGICSDYASARGMTSHDSKYSMVLARENIVTELENDIYWSYFELQDMIYRPKFNIDVVCARHHIAHVCGFEL